MSSNSWRNICSVIVYKKVLQRLERVIKNNGIVWISFMVVMVMSG